MGLAVYALPAMDDWSRAIVRPLAIKAFDRAMSEQLTAADAGRASTASEVRDWRRHRRLGETMLTHAFDLAEAIDDVDTLLSDELVWSPVPDPDDPSRDIGLPGGRPVRFVARIDRLISDAADEQWIVDHRIAWDDWATDEVLLEDDEQRRAIWAIQLAYPQLAGRGDRRQRAPPAARRR